MKKQRSGIMTSLVLLYVVFFSFSMVQLSQARYKTTAQADMYVNTAKWTFKINGKENETQEIVIDLSQCADVDDRFQSPSAVVGPGAHGSFDLEIDCTGSNVAIQYEIQSTKDGAFPDNIIFTTGSGAHITYISDTSKISGTFTLDDIKTNPIKTIPIDWNWQLEELDDENEYQGKELKLKLTIKASQIYEDPADTNSTTDNSTDTNTTT